MENAVGWGFRPVGLQTVSYITCTVLEGT